MRQEGNTWPRGSVVAVVETQQTQHAIWPGRGSRGRLFRSCVVVARGKVMFADDRASNQEVGRDESKHDEKRRRGDEEHEEVIYNLFIKSLTLLANCYLSPISNLSITSFRCHPVLSLYLLSLKHVFHAVSRPPRDTMLRGLARLA